MNENYHNFRSSHDIDMTVTKTNRNTATLKTIDDHIMSANCDVIVFFPNYGQFATIRKTDSGRMFYTIFIFINYYLLSYENRTKKFVTQLS